MEPLGSNDNFPEVQIWRPLSLGSSIYKRVAQEQLELGTSVQIGIAIFYIINKSSNFLTDFQFGDVIGYYQPLSPRRLISSIRTSGYTSYIINNVSSPSNTIDINNVDNVETDLQPLIELHFGKYTH